MWDIKNTKTISSKDRQKYWENTHRTDNYETVWSMTDDLEVRNKILHQLSQQDNLAKILIPGCGSKVLLQNDIAAKYPNASILCTDYSGVIEIAQEQSNLSNIKYKALNSTNLDIENEFDALIIVNSILSESHKENIEILNSCFKSLKPNGKLIGFFPTVFASIDIASIENNKDRMGFVDLEKSSFYEEKQEIWQIFYTPLRLRHALKETGFNREVIEIYFCDSEYFTAHSDEYYGIKDPDLPVYEHFVVAHKPKIN